MLLATNYLVAEESFTVEVESETVEVESLTGAVVVESAAVVAVESAEASVLAPPQETRTIEAATNNTANTFFIVNIKF
jgi:hypothetical protein